MVLGVPVLIPLAWFMVIYLAYCLTQKLIGDRSLLWNSVMGAVAATAWDVVADPQMARTGLWIWDRGGDFFGVPIQNFVGWWITSFIVLLLYHTVTRTLPPVTSTDPSPSFALLPVIAYAGLALSFIIGYAGQGEGALAVITFFTMGAMSLIALAKT
jgi:putative membrane protein